MPKIKTIKISQATCNTIEAVSNDKLIIKSPNNLFITSPFQSLVHKVFNKNKR